MSLYYVYLRWYKEKDSRCGQWARQILTCESRYVADEFFRACKELKDNRGRSRFTRLERNNPQFWLYDTTDGDPWMSLFDILGANLGMPDSVKGRIMPTLLHDGPSRIWDAAPVIPGRDWVHNCSYFIRNIRQPELYWSLDPSSSTILVSDKQKTKFRVSAVQFGRDDKNKVLIRSDIVRLSLPNNPAAVGATAHVRVATDSGVICGADAGEFTFRFGDLLGNFGSKWAAHPAGDAREFLTWSEQGEQDDWELC
jgi:hypothetical protein